MSVTVFYVLSFYRYKTSDNSFYLFGVFVVCLCCFSEEIAGGQLEFSHSSKILVGAGSTVTLFFF